MEVPWLPYTQVANLAGNMDISVIISTDKCDDGSGSLSQTSLMHLESHLESIMSKRGSDIQEHHVLAHVLALVT